MKGITKPRSERLRSNVPGPAELRRLAAWWEGIGDDWQEAAIAAGRLKAGYDPAKLDACQRAEREARLMAAQLRAKVADR